MVYPTSHTPTGHVTYACKTKDRNELPEDYTVSATSTPLASGLSYLPPSPVI